MTDIYLENNITKTTTIEYNRFKIKNYELSLNEKVKIVILLYPVNPEHVVEARTIIMEGEDYANWGLDDNYVINFIKTKLLE